MCLNRSLHDGEAEPGPSNATRYERFEQTLAQFSRDPGTIIGHLEYCRAIEPQSSRQFVWVHRPHPYHYVRLSGAGLHGIENQIDHDTVDEVLVSLHRDRDCL